MAYFLQRPFDPILPQWNPKSRLREWRSRAAGKISPLKTYRLLNNHHNINNHLTNMSNSANTFTKSFPLNTVNARRLGDCTHKTLVLTYIQVNEHIQDCCECMTKVFSKLFLTFDIYCVIVIVAGGLLLIDVVYSFGLSED